MGFGSSISGAVKSITSSPAMAVVNPAFGASNYLGADIFDAVSGGDSMLKGLLGGGDVPNYAGAGAAEADAMLRSAALQKQAADEALDFQREQFTQAREDLDPYRQAGTQALGTLQQRVAQGPMSMSDYLGSDEYQYLMDRANQATQRSAAARGLLSSGGTARALQENAFGLGLQGYGNKLDRYYASLRPLQGLASSGQNAAAGMGGISQNFANTGTQTMLGGAAAQGAGLTGAAQARTRGQLMQQQAEAQQRNQTLGTLGQLGGMGLGFALGGPAGGMLGSQVGGAAGGGWSGIYPGGIPGAGGMSGQSPYYQTMAQYS